MERATGSSPGRGQSTPCPQPAQLVPQGHHTTPHTRGNGFWRRTGIVSLRPCSQQGWPSTLSWTPKVTRSSSSSELSDTPLQAAQMEQVLSQAAETAFLKGCTGSGQLQARLMPRGCSQLHLAAVSPCPHLPERHQSPLQGKWQLSLPHLTDWCCGLRTNSCHSQFFPISLEKSSSLHHNPEKGQQHHKPLHTSGAQHEPAAKAPLEGHVPAPDYNCQQQTLRDDCQG